jgi:trimeric autotransporter adhesin
MVVGNAMILKMFYALIGAFFLNAAQLTYAIGFIESQLNNTNGIIGLGGAVSTVMSPDGSSVYAAGFSEQSIVTFSRQTSGKLTYIETYTNTTNLNGINGLAISNEGKFIYGANLFANGIAVFSRATDGKLTFVELLKNGIRSADGLNQVNSVSLSSDNKFLYATSSSGIVVFSRDLNSGLLQFVEIKTVSGATSTALSSDNKHLYATASNDNAVQFFSRDTLSGRLTLMGTYTNGINEIIGLGGAYDVVISPDGSRVYVAGNTDNAIVVFNRNVISGTLTFLISYNADVANGLLGVRALAVSPDSAKLYAAGSSQHALVEFDVNSTGLSRKMMLQNGSNGVSGISGISDVIVSPNGLNLYATGLDSSGVGVFSAKMVDLSITQTLPAEGLINTSFSSQITVNNVGADTATNVTLKDVIPAGVTVNTTTTSQGTCTNVSNTIACNLGSLTTSASATVNITLTPTVAGVLNHNPNVTSSEPDSNSSNNQNLSTINVLSKIAQADLGVTLTPSATLVNSNSDLTYSVTVTNAGADDATLSVLNIQLPDTLVYSSVETSQGSCTYTAPNLKCSLGLITSNSTVKTTIYTITPTALVDLAATATVNSSTKDPNSANNSASTTVKVQPMYTDLVIKSLVAQTTNIDLGQSAVLTATLANVSTHDTSNVILGLTFTPTDGARFLGATTSVQVSDSQKPCIEVAAGQLKCALGTFNANNSAQTLQFSLYPLKSGTLSVSANITANATDTMPTDNLSTLNLNVTGDAVDLGIVQTASPSSAALDNPIVFSTVITNSNDTKKATNVRLTDTIPLGVDFIGVLSSQGSCNESAGVISCLLGEILAKSTAKVDISLRPRNLGNLQHSVQISADTFDPNSSNNSNTLLLTVNEAKIDLENTLSVDKTSILPGDEVNYSLKLTNNGPAQADTVFARWQITNLLAISSASTDQGSCTINQQEITCSIGSIGVAKSVNLNVRTIAQQAGTGEVTVDVAGLQQDVKTSNNKTTLKATVNLPPALFYVSSWQTSNLAGATDLTLTPDGKHLYVAAFNSNQVTAFSRDSDGKIQEIQIISHANLQHPASIVTTGDGNWVLVTSYANNSIEVFQRNATTGELIWQQSLKAPDLLTGPFSMVASGQTVYVSGLGTKNLIGFQIDNAGKVAGLAAFKQNTDGVSGLDGVTAMAISPDGSRLYLTALNDNALTVFNRTTAGNLTFVQSYNNTINGASGVAISPDHAHIYVASSTNQTIFALKRDSNGSLTPLEAYSTPQLDSVSQLKMSTDGLWLYATAGNVNTLNVFSRDSSTGLLKSSTPLVNAQNNVNGLAGIRAMAVASDGNVYTASIVDGAIAMFRPPQADLKLSILTDTSAPVSGQTFAYLLTIQNAGPDPSSNLTLTGQLTSNLTLQSVSTNQGIICQANSMSCQLAGLDAGKSATLRVTVLPTSQGVANFSAKVTGQQIDPQPADNTAILNTSILGRADLQLNLAPDFDAISLGNSLSYKISLTNAGPDNANNVNLNITLPNTVRFMSAMLGGSLCGYQNNTVTCYVAQLNNQAELTGSILVTPLQTGILQAQATVSANQVDPTSPNQVTALVEITNNIINIAYDNTNKTLSGAKISSSGSVSGGMLAGHIENNGLISNLQIVANTLVTGGKLGGTIQSLGIVENVYLNASAQLSGGIIKGIISGNGGILQNLHIAANTTLSGVLIGSGVIFDGAITFGVNVQFANNSQIPTGTDLTAILATIPVTGLNIQALNLSTDAVKFGIPLLSQINAIPLLSNSRLAFTQLNTGLMVLALGDGNYIYLVPLKVTQTTDATNLILNDNHSIQFITAQGRNIIAQPVLAINISNVMNLNLLMQLNGNVQITQPDNSFVLFRMGMAVTIPSIVDKLNHPFELTLTDGYLKNVNNFALLFDDILGQRRQQIFYRTVYSFNAWRTWAQKYQFNLTFSPDGVVNIKVGNDLYKGVFDYFVTKGLTPSNGELNIASIPDKNQDGINDFLITYPDGSQQIMYFIF